jgi:hydroxymethylpyrimidine/phosphomethylpyrimidine kinase
LGAPLVTVLTIAGTDPTGKAGVAADLRTFASFGVHGAVALTAVTAQDDSGVYRSTVLDPGLVAAQIEAAASGPISAVKSGMLGDSAVVSVVAEAVAKHSLGPLVVDPVIWASSGGQLLATDAWPRLVSELLPLAALVTPNLPEVEALLGRPVRRRDQMPAAAAELSETAGCAVLLKGGHLEDDEGPDLLCPDLLWQPSGEVWLDGPRLAGTVRGTGCVLSSAIAALLAAGEPLEGACRAAKKRIADLFSG